MVVDRTEEEDDGFFFWGRLKACHQDWLIRWRAWKETHLVCLHQNQVPPIVMYGCPWPLLKKTLVEAPRKKSFSTRKHRASISLLTKEMENGRWKLFLLFLISQLSFSISLDLPAHGCYWTDSCQNKWIGGCGAGHVIINQSADCNGLCSAPKYPPCLPFHTHFHCCKSESPKVTDRCTKCKNKVDFGDEYICCMDCSDPYITDKSTKMGFCKTGAELAVQLKPREHFTWVAGPWMSCSSPCDGGIRYRDVECFGQLEDMSIPHYPVDDSRCLEGDMPLRQEPCNLRSCAELTSRDSRDGRMSSWLIMLLVLMGVVAVGAVGFAGYTLYKRRTSAQRGFVYIMLDGYS